LLRNKREENLLAVVRQGYVPLPQFFAIHAALFDSRF
jgi:hypothetical protein